MGIHAQAVYRMGLSSTTHVPPGPPNRGPEIPGNRPFRISAKPLEIEEICQHITYGTLIGCGLMSCAILQLPRNHRIVDRRPRKLWDRRAA